MTDNYQTPTRNFIRGGQVLLHNYRMMSQLFIRILIFALVIFSVVTVGVSYVKLDKWHIFAVKNWCYAHTLKFFGIPYLKVYYPNGKMDKAPSAEVAYNPWIIATAKQSSRVVFDSMNYGFGSSIASIILVVAFLRRRGRKQSETRMLRGYEVGTIKQVNRLMRKKGASNIKIAGVTMPKGFETGHVLIHGTTGMGKSVCIKELLDQIRKRGDRAIIYDIGGDYINSFYKSGDVILNPLDARTVSWNLWKECRDSADYDSLAAALIPSVSEHSDPFWSSGAKIIFAAMARKLSMADNPSILDLLNAILTGDIKVIEKHLRNTEAASLVSGGIEKTALSFRATLASYLKCLKYIKDEKNPFSIRNWIQNDNNKNWLFISSTADRHETLKPLISMWLDLASNSLLSLTPSNTRRIWLVFDELASLHRLPYLPNAFAQSRKFGGCIIAGMQSIAQLRKVYGNHAADEISTMCNTRIFFRSPSNEAAVWTSKELGQHEIEEMREGISYSESAMRSGISIDKQRLQKDLVSPVEIMRLHVLEAYMRLPGELPITKIKLKYKKRDNKVSGFIARKIIEKELLPKQNIAISKHTENKEEKDEEYALNSSVAEKAKDVDKPELLSQSTKTETKNIQNTYGEVI